jgi:hypothetical protein
MLIYYFELKKAAFWFIDFQQPSLGDIQMPLGLCGLPTAGRLCVLARYFIFFSQRRRDAKELPSPSVRRGGEEDLFFFSRRRE